jgi:hypothetical protein
MRFRKSFWKISPALLAAAALILIAGVVGAVIDADESIDPESPDYDASEGGVDLSGDEFDVRVSFRSVCVDPDDPKSKDNDFEFGCESTHIDRVNLSTHQGSLDQKMRNNNAHAWMDVTEIGGGVKNTIYDLACERVLIKGKSNDDTEKIEARCTLRKCTPPKTHNNIVISDEQFQSALDCLDTSEEDGSLGERVQTLRLDKNGEFSGEITSKGVWLEDD